MLRMLAKWFRRIRFCRSLKGLPVGTIVFFPLTRTQLPCGLAGIVEIVRAPTGAAPDLAAAEAAVEGLSANGLAPLGEDITTYGGGETAIRSVEDLVHALRRPEVFPLLFADDALLARATGLAGRIRAFVDAEVGLLDRGESLPNLAGQEVVNRILTRLKDAAWALEREIAVNVDRVRDLLGETEAVPKALREYRKLNLILNTLDRLEIRGRDSAGVLLQVAFEKAADLDEILARHEADRAARIGLPDLPDGAICLSEDGRCVTLVYKVAAEVGKLGDNVAVLRNRIRADRLLSDLLSSLQSQALVAAHTRWASNGITTTRTATRSTTPVSTKQPFRPSTKVSPRTSTSP